MLYEPSRAEASVSRRPSGVQTGNDVLLLVVRRLDVPRVRSISHRSSALPRIAVTRRRPSGDTRGCAYGWPDATGSCPPPERSTQTRLFDPAAFVATYTIDPVSE